MVFKLSRTFSDPANSQSGFPSPGAGAQTTGSATPPPTQVPWTPVRPTKGIRSFLEPFLPQSKQRGYPTPENPGQRRPPGSMPNVPPVYGGPIPVYTDYFSRGAAAYVQNYGKVLTNPIGAGVAVSFPMRPQAPAAQYYDGAIWWTSQAIPTSVNLQGLTDPAEIAALLDPLQIEAVVRTTG